MLFIEAPPPRGVTQMNVGLISTATYEEGDGCRTRAPTHVWNTPGSVLYTLTRVVYTLACVILYPSIGNGIDFDPKKVLGRSQGPTAGRMSLLTTY